MSLMASYYADDFTGATDSLEALATRGIRTMLFLEPPGLELLREKYAHLDCVGVAGTSRAMTPQQMEQELKPLLERIRQWNTPIMHYKICSTADSSPDIGSIGKVIELARPWNPWQPSIPVLAAAPHLKRYTVFGQHYASMNGECYRLDRHPVMSRHPVTPMREADLRIHLSRQTKLGIQGVTLTELEQSELSLQEIIIDKDAEIVVLDAYNEAHTCKIGQWLWEQAAIAPQFVIGSSGVQLALSESWPNRGRGAKNDAPPGRCGPILVLSGSCSAVTQKQIEWAKAKGFADIRLNTEELIDNAEAVESVASQAVNLIGQGISVIAYTALGPDDPSIAGTKQRLKRSGLHEGSGAWLGSQLGRIGRRVAEQSELRRLVFAGGDTSGFAAKEMGIDALELLYPAAPGAPLCICHSRDSRIATLELALKGGQLGGEDYFERILNGE